MKNQYEVIIFSESDLFEIIKVELSKDPSIKICGRATNLSDLEKLLPVSKQAIVVAEVKPQMLIAPRSTEITDYFKKRKLTVLSVCENIKDGFAALQEGSAAMIVKPKDMGPDEAFSFSHNLKAKIKTIVPQSDLDRTRVLKQNRVLTFDKIIAIGASTGGTEMIIKIIRELPADAPPVLVVQHMPPVFTRLYAERMNLICKMAVWEARDGDLLRPGLVLIAPGDYHMTLTKTNGQYAVKCEKGERFNGHCPSVDMLFYSIAEVAGKDALGVIMTGMGSDGAKGLLEMRKKGSITLGQDEQSSVVYGMPKVAHGIGAVTKQVSLDEMAKTIMENL